MSIIPFSDTSMGNINLVGKKGAILLDDIISATTNSLVETRDFLVNFIANPPADIIPGGNRSLLSQSLSVESSKNAAQPSLDLVNTEILKRLSQSLTQLIPSSSVTTSILSNPLFLIAVAIFIAAIILKKI